jgi:hypothetical protein
MPYFRVGVYTYLLPKIPLIQDSTVERTDSDLSIVSKSIKDLSRNNAGRFQVPHLSIDGGIGEKRNAVKFFFNEVVVQGRGSIHLCTANIAAPRKRKIFWGSFIFCLLILKNKFILSSLLSSFHLPTKFQPWLAQIDDL